MASFSVVSNVSATNAQANLNTTNIGLQQALTRLSSGYRINRSGDDAAGLVLRRQRVVEAVAELADDGRRLTAQRHPALAGGKRVRHPPRPSPDQLGALLRLAPARTTTAADAGNAARSS